MLFEIPMPGFRIPVSDVVIATWVVMAIIIGLAVLLTARMKVIPGKRQVLAEMLVDTVNGLVRDHAGHHYRMIAPYIGTVLIFLVTANTISLFNIIPDWKELFEMTGWRFFEHLPEFHLLPPTRNINVTVALAGMSILSVVIFGIRAKGFRGWLRGFRKPNSIMLPFNILDYVIRPLSLSFRLFGNILGAMVVMELIYLAIPMGIPAALSVFFDLFDGLLQAYIFAFLTTMYIGEVVEA